MLQLNVCNFVAWALTLVRFFGHWILTRFLNTDKEKSDPFWALEINQILEHWKLTRFLITGNEPDSLTPDIYQVIFEQ